VKQRMKRRKYLIDKKLQLSLAGNMLLIAFVSMVFTAFFSGWLFLFVMNDRLSGSLGKPFIVKVTVIFMFMAVGIAIWTVKRSHSIAGPIFKVRKVLNEAASGVFPDYPVKFRKGDAFKELTEDLNRCMDIMRSHHEEERKSDT